MLRAFSCCVMFLLFVAQSSRLEAEVVTMEGTVKSVDAKKRTISVETDGKTKEFEVSSKTKIKNDGKEASLDSLKSGQKISLSYHDDLDVVVSIQLSPKVGASIAIPLDEINSSGTDVNPSLTGNGLDIVWQSGQGGRTMICKASRVSFDSPFTKRNRDFLGV